MGSRFARILTPKLGHGVSATCCQSLEQLRRLQPGLSEHQSRSDTDFI